MPETGTLVDAGFEGRVDGAVLDAGIWTVLGTPTNAEYDTALKKNGSVSAYIVAASNAFQGFQEATTAAIAGIDGAELRFWVYSPSLQSRRVYDRITSGSTYGSFLLLLNYDGNIQVNMAKATPGNGYVTGYNTIGTYTTGWTQFRITFNFTAQTITISQRMTSGTEWTQLKAAGATGYDIPMRGTGTCSYGGAAFQAYGIGVSMSVDDVRYSTTPITETPDPVSITGAYTAADLNTILANNAIVNATGRVMVTGGSVVINNQSLVLSGTGVGTSIEAPGFQFVKFKTIQNLEYLKSNNTQNFTGADCLRFTGAANFSAITTPKISSCGLDGILQFGELANFVYNDADPYFKSTAIPNCSGLSIEDCTLTAGITGAMTGPITFLRCSGIVDSRGNVWKGMSFGGKDITLDSCDTEIQNTECHLKLAPGNGWGKSITGFRAINCSFTGGHEEMLGMDTPLPAFNGHVTAKTASSVTVAIDHNPYEGYEDENYVWHPGPDNLVGTTIQVGRHLFVNNGTAFGNYYEITAQNNDVLTLDTSTWGTGDITVGDRITVACALVGSLWDNNDVYMKRGFRDRGYGCNVGFSMHGNCYGNTISHNRFHLPTPLALPVGTTPIPLPGVGTNPAGPAITASSYAVAMNETSVYINEFSGCNAHNTYHGNVVDDNIGVFMAVQTLNYTNETPETLRPPTWGNHDLNYGGFLTVTDNVYSVTAVCEVQDVKSIVWTGNTTAAPETHYTGICPADYTQPVTTNWPYTQRNAYDALNTVNWKWYDQPNYLWEYKMDPNDSNATGIGLESATTWAAPLDPSDVILDQDGTVSWTDNANNESEYHVEWLVNNVTWGDLRELVANTTSEAYGSLLGVSSLQARVTALDANGGASRTILSNTITFNVRYYDNPLVTGKGITWLS